MDRIVTEVSFRHIAYKLPIVTIVMLPRSEIEEIIADDDAMNEIKEGIAEEIEDVTKFPIEFERVKTIRRKPNVIMCFKAEVNPILQAMNVDRPCLIMTLPRDVVGHLTSSIDDKNLTADDKKKKFHELITRQTKAMQEATALGKFDMINSISSMIVNGKDTMFTFDEKENIFVASKTPLRCGLTSKSERLICTDGALPKTVIMPIA